MCSLLARVVQNRRTNCIQYFASVNMDPELRHHFMALSKLVMAIQEKQDTLDARMRRIETKLDKLLPKTKMQEKETNLETLLPVSGNVFDKFRTCETFEEIELLEKNLKRFTSNKEAFKEWLERKINYKQPKKRALRAFRLIISIRLQVKITWTGRAKDRVGIAMQNYNTVLEVIKEVSGEHVTSEDVKKWVQRKLHRNWNLYSRRKGAATIPPPFVHTGSVKDESLNATNNGLGVLDPLDITHKYEM